VQILSFVLKLIVYGILNDADVFASTVYLLRCVWPEYILDPLTLIRLSESRELNKDRIHSLKIKFFEFNSYPIFP
jgi:hypothetical protein